LRATKGPEQQRSAAVKNASKHPAALLPKGQLAKIQKRHQMAATLIFFRIKRDIAKKCFFYSFK
jgi:hypothetical protein